MRTTSPPRHRPGRWSRPALTALSALALAATAACGGGEAAAPEPAADAAPAPTTRTISTEQGTVEVPADPQRIVVLSGGLAGYLYALDAPVAATDTRVLGVTNLDGGFPPAWADAATEQGTTPLPAGEQLSIEAVAAADPDLIVGGGQGITAVQAAENYQTLTEIAPTVLVPTTVVAWQEQLRLVAGAIGREDRVAELVQAYEDKVAEVEGAITVPPEPVVFILSLPNGKPYLIPQNAALPALAGELGFTADDVLTKAGNPPLYGSGDSFEVSPELLAQTATAPRAFVVALGGPTAEQLAKDPVYAQLPAFQAGQVHELPASSYRPDYDAAMATLDVFAGEFAG